MYLDRYEVKEVRVEKFKSGEHEGEWRQFTLPRCSIAIDVGRISWIGDYPTLILTIGAPVAT
jgi:hypothetical protein